MDYSVYVESDRMIDRHRREEQQTDRQTERGRGEEREGELQIYSNCAIQQVARVCSATVQYSKW